MKRVGAAIRNGAHGEDPRQMRGVQGLLEIEVTMEATDTDPPSPRTEAEAINELA